MQAELAHRKRRATERRDIAITIAIIAALGSLPIVTLGISPSESTSRTTPPTAPTLRGPPTATLASAATGYNFTVSTLADGGWPLGIAYDRHLKAMAVANYRNSTVSVYNASSGNKTWEQSVERPRAIATNEVSDLAYVTDFNGSVNVLNLSTSTLVKSVTVGYSADGIAYVSGASSIYVTYYTDGNVTALSAVNYSTVATISIGGCPSTPAYDPQNGTLFVSNACSPTLAIVNTTRNTVEGNISFSGAPEAVAYDPAVNILWVGESDGTLLAYNATTYAKLGSVLLPGTIMKVTTDPELGTVYALGRNGTAVPWVAMVEGAEFSVTGLVNLSSLSSPSDLAVDGASHSVWVSDLGDNCIWVLSPVPWRVSFEETGLASGTAWSMVVGRVNESSSTNQIAFSLFDGSYAYVVNPVAGFARMPSGNLTVAGADQTIRLTFTAFTYPVVYSETGLPPGTDWGVTLAGVHATSSGTTIGFAQSNGTWNYTIDPIAGFTTTWSGSMVVHATAVSLLVSFTTVAYSARFIETGLPDGANWTVTLGASSVTASSSIIAFALANGTYAYRLAGVAGWSTANYSGTVEVGGASLTRYVAWYATTFPVVISETGLANGTSWWLNLTGGASAGSTSTSASLRLPNGSYLYTLASSDKSFESPGGSFTVQGESVSIGAAFLPVTYTVQFTETGLPAGTVWSVRFHSVDQTGTGSLSFSGTPNGTYAFSIQTIAGYVPTPSTGSVFVHGSPAPVAISFAPTGPTGATGTQPTLLGLPPLVVIGLIAIVVGVTVTLTVLWVRRKR